MSPCPRLESSAGTVCDPLERALCGRSRPSIHSSPPYESLVSSLASPSLGVNLLIYQMEILLTGKDLDCFGKLSQESTEAGWTNASKQTNKGKFNGKRFNIWTLVQKQLCQEVTERRVEQAEAGGNGCWVF